MKKTNFLYLIIALLAIINLFFVWRFLIHPPHFDPDLPKRIVIHKLNFDKDQIVKYEQLIQQHRSQIHTNDSLINSLKNTLYQQLKSDSPNSDSLLTLLSDAQKNTELIHFKHFEDIKLLCKPDQKPLFDNLTQELTTIFKGKPIRK